MRPRITIAAVALVSIAACSRPMTPGTTTSYGRLTKATLHYCEVKPDMCETCRGEPGSCGGEPAAGACCGDFGCVGVEWAEMCPLACEFHFCEWGYETVLAGSIEFVCFD